VTRNEESTAPAVAIRGESSPGSTACDALSTGAGSDAAPWTVRYSWSVPDGSEHPPRTYEPHGSETSAVDHAVAKLDIQMPGDSLRIVSAHIKLPDGGWRRVE